MKQQLLPPAERKLLGPSRFLTRLLGAVGYLATVGLLLAAAPGCSSAGGGSSTDASTGVPPFDGSTGTDGGPPTDGPGPQSIPDGGFDSASPNQPDASSPSPRTNINFNTDWVFNRGDVTGANEAAFVDTAWPYVDLPHSIDFATPESPDAYLGVAWYRKHFTVDDRYRGGKVFLEFGAAMQQADVYVNGTHMIAHSGGYAPFTTGAATNPVTHVGGYAPFTLDVTSNLTFGGADNVIAVRIDTTPNANWGPGNPDPDFQYYGGLYRDVTMHMTNLLHVSDAVYANIPGGGGVFVTYPSVGTSSATVAIATDVINESMDSRSATVLSQLVDSTGAVVGSQSSTASIDAGEDYSFVQSMTIVNPQLWHPYTPNLYTLRTTVSDGATAVDDVTTTVGIRSIAWTHDGGLSINGSRFYGIGANMHQDIYGLGNAVPDRSIYYDVKRIKDGGMNFIRGSHFPHSPAFYDACDQLGVLVLDAQSGWQFYPSGSATTFDTNTYQELRDMIRRDRNHPSVVAWEASLNETSVPLSWAEMTNSIVHEEYPGTQAYSAQYWQGNTVSDIRLESSQAGVRTAVDTRPILISEYGDWDYGGADSTSRQAREAGDTAMLTQAANVEDGTSKNQVLPWLSTAGYWDYSDYGGFTTYGMVLCGLVDMYRLPKFGYYFMQSQRDPTVVIPGVSSGPMVFIANQWTSTSPTMVDVYSNCSQVRLSVNGTAVGTQGPITGTNLLHPPFRFDLSAYTPGTGTLAAACLIDGSTAASTTVTAPGAPVAIRLAPEGTTLDADMSDARLIFIYILDANRTVVPSASTEVNLSVSGPGTLVGPATVTMKGGELAAWVRAQRTVGTITLTASAAGLTSATATLTSQAVANLLPAPADCP